MFRLSVIALLLFSCGTEEPDDSDENNAVCDIAGRWSLTVTVGTGDCAGFITGAVSTDSLTLTANGGGYLAQWDNGETPDSQTFTKSSCSLILIDDIAEAETGTTPEIRGKETDTFTFDVEANTLTGAATVALDFYESGTKIGDCTHGVSFTGSR